VQEQADRIPAHHRAVEQIPAEDSTDQRRGSADAERPQACGLVRCGRELRRRFDPRHHAALSDSHALLRKLREGCSGNCGCRLGAAQEPVHDLVDELIKGGD
jgi:hypothetical protein